MDWTIPNNSAIEARKLKFGWHHFRAYDVSAAKPNQFIEELQLFYHCNWYFSRFCMVFFQTKTLHIYARITFLSQWMPAIWVIWCAFKPNIISRTEGASNPDLSCTAKWMGFPAKNQGCLAKTGVFYRTTMEKTIVLNCWKLKITYNQHWLPDGQNRWAVPPRPLLVGDWGTRNFQLNSFKTQNVVHWLVHWNSHVILWCDQPFVYIPPENPEIPYQPGSWSRSILVYCLASATMTITTSFGLNGAPVSLHPAIPVAGHWLLTPHKWGKVRKCGKIKGKKSRQITTDLPQDGGSSQVSGQHQRFSMF